MIRPHDTAMVRCFCHAVILLVLPPPSVSSLPTMVKCQSFASRWAGYGIPRHRSRLTARSLSLHPFASGGGTAIFSTTGKDNGIPGPDLPPLDESCKRLFLVRHGEVINPGGDRPVYYGAMDVPLSKVGEEEAKAAAEYLRRFDLDVVVTSPLSRAVYGAELVLARQKRSKKRNSTVAASAATPAPPPPSSEGIILTMEGFRELDRGSWCGKTKDEIGPDIMSRFDACDESVTPEGGESYPTLRGRVLTARDEVLAGVPPGGSAAIVSHLQVTRCILSDALGVPTSEMARLKVSTASVTCIDYDGTGLQTVRFQSFKPETGVGPSKDGAN
jgi:broad specificity phosphatase PhoE